MPRPSHKEKILNSGLRVEHERGYAASSVRDIIEATGVPQGSFTNHFASKEAFGLELVNIYYKDIELFMADTLLNRNGLAILDCGGPSH
jgi:TetR/AcrR family transcriptional regulator, transcriptional repressor for nem operon